VGDANAKGHGKGAEERARREAREKNPTPRRRRYEGDTILQKRRREEASSPRSAIARVDREKLFQLDRSTNAVRTGRRSNASERLATQHRLGPLEPHGAARQPPHNADDREIEFYDGATMISRHETEKR